jgi:hypothetical protein
MWMWLTGRTFGTSGSQCMRIWFSPGQMGSLGRLACKGGLWPTRCRRLSPHPGRPRRLAASCRWFCWLFQQGGSAQLHLRAVSGSKPKLLVTQQLGFSMDTTRACFHADGKYCLRRTALNTFVRKVIARLGRRQRPTLESGRSTPLYQITIPNFKQERLHKKHNCMIIHIWKPVRRICLTPTS